MGIQVEHKTTGEVKWVVGSRDLLDASQWTIVAKSPCAPEEVRQRHGTGLPPRPRTAVKNTRRRYG